MIRPTLDSLLDASPALASLDAPTRRRLAADARGVELPRGRVLFLEGDQPDAAYVVGAGLVRVFVTEPDGRETTVRLVEHGGLVGELAMLVGGTRNASAIALRRTFTYRLPAASFAGELPAAGTLAHALMRGLVDVVRDETRRLSRLRTSDVEQLVAGAVVDDPGVLSRVSQGELASLLGLSRQSVNETLRRWEVQGLIVRDAGRVLVRDELALRSRAPRR